MVRLVDREARLSEVGVKIPWARAWLARLTAALSLAALVAAVVLLAGQSDPIWIVALLAPPAGLCLLVLFGAYAGPGEPARTESPRDAPVRASPVSFIDATALGAKSVDGADAAQLQATIAQLRDELEATQQALTRRSQFIATASHDLRQPLHAIGLFAAALRAELTAGRARYLLDRLERAMHGLDELFNRLLDISRLDAGHIKPREQSFAVGPLLQTLESRFAALAQQKGLEFKLYTPRIANVRSDPTMLSELLMNLLSNAVRHTQRGGILIGARRRGNRLAIEIWDTGPGIAPADRDRVFDEFVQLDNSGRDLRRGVGLGLSIVRRLSAALGCPITLRSRVGRGSVFSVSVALSNEPVDATALPATLAGGGELNGTLVLVVDSQIDVLIGMQAMLSGWGCFVLIARSLEELESLLEQGERFPDALITDDALANGVTVGAIAAVVDALVPISVPMIVVSSAGDVHADQADTAGRVTVISKPAEPARLQAALLDCVRRSVA